MNQQQQIDIIQAHMAGRRVLECPRVIAIDLDGKTSDHNVWCEVTKDEYCFDFQGHKYKIEPRKLDLFMALPSGVLQALGRDAPVSHTAYIGNEPPRQLQPGHVIVKIHCTEPES